MSNGVSVKTPGGSDASVTTALLRKPRRRRIAKPGRQSIIFALLNLLHQELECINAGIIRTNDALVELADEARSMRMSQPEISSG